MIEKAEKGDVEEKEKTRTPNGKRQRDRLNLGLDEHSTLTSNRLLSEQLGVGTLSSDSGRSDQDGGDVDLHCECVFEGGFRCRGIVR